MAANRYQLVDSLYGPGTVGAWLLTLCSILISWTLNTSSRRKDTVSIDFLAGLLLPLIAAAHVMFQLARLPISVAEAITTQDVELQMYASALEAPLNICETFSVTALILAVTCGPWWESGPKWKRLISILVTGLFSWSTENIMFATAMIRGVQVVDVTLSRPYLFFLAPIVTSTWAFLTICLMIYAVGWLIDYLGSRGQQQKDLENDPHPRLAHRDKSFNRADQSTPPFVKEMQSWESDRDARISKFMSVLTMLYLPFSVSGSVFGLLFLNMADEANTSNYRFYLIPKSTGSLRSLDQILALVGGVLTLLSAIHSAYRSWVPEDRKGSKTVQLKRRRSI